MKAAIYCRLSEEDKKKQRETDESESIQNQKSMLIQYALDHQWEIYQIYSDDNFPGADRNRPEFQKLLADAEQRRFDIVLCKTQSRFTRELELVEKYIHGLFPVWNIRFISVVDHADTDSKGNKKARQINGLVNEWYLEDMSENIKSVLTNKRKLGFHIGSFALYGYQKDPLQKGHLIIDEEAAQIVREVFELFAQGYGKTKIARLLNERGVPNPTEYKRRQGLRYQQAKSGNSTLWKYATIAKMLENKTYLGHLIQGRYGSVSYKTKQNRCRPKEQWIVAEHTHEAIIDLDLWNEVQALREKRAKPLATGEIGLFAGKVRCMHCGYHLRSVKSRGRRYLQCQNRFVAERACPGTFLSVSQLETIVLEQLRAFSNQYLDAAQLSKKMNASVDASREIKKIQNEILLYQKKRDEYQLAKKELYLDKVNKVITVEDYLAFSQEFSERLQEMEEKILDQQSQLSAWEQDSGPQGDEVQETVRLCQTDRLDRELVDALIDVILVGKKDAQTNQLPIEIHWKF